MVLHWIIPLPSSIFLAPVYSPFNSRPDNCDGTFDANCDTSRAYTNITAILSAGAPDTLSYMQTYWKDYQGHDETFWEHEWGKHGTCMSTLNPSCYTNYQSCQEAVDFFNTAVAVFKTLPSYTWLQQAGIVPSTTKTYTLAAIQAALKSHHGHNVIINCKSGALNELWYQFNVQGSIASGKFVASDPVGSGSTCPSTGIKYLPKSGGSSSPSTTPTTPTTSSSGSAPSGGSSGKGTISVTAQDGSGSQGFLISTGKWYNSGGSPATYTATGNSDGSSVALKTSKGNCAIQSDSSLFCGSGVSASTFAIQGGLVTYNGASTFYASNTPSGSDQETVYASEQDVAFSLTWNGA